MGLIKAAIGAVDGVLSDQWKEFIYCDSLSADVLAAKGQKRVSGRSSNTSASDNIISNGSVIAVNDGQCMIIVEQGKVVDICAEPGEYVYDKSTEPSLFSGNLADNIKPVFEAIGRRFAFGGDTGKDQRVYFFNVKEIVGNKYGTPSAVPFRVVDNNIGLDMDISIKCFGEYSYRLTNPILFYTNVCGNVEDVYDRSNIDSQLKSELMTALQPAFAKISEMGIRYSALPGHTMEIADALNQVLSKKWGELRGIEIVAFGVNSVKASEEDEQMIKEIQRNGALRNPTMAAAHLTGAQAQAMQSAAANEGGAAMGFFGMGMANAAGGMNAQQLFAMGQQQNAQQQAPQTQSAGWTCSCGQQGNTGKFCTGCGQPKPAPAGGEAWTCSCGHAGNTGKFCAECGKPRPSGSWHCPSCGTKNEGKFCQQCGAKNPMGM
ncbi:MAG: SPFH domain-containing protein [Selenomonadaceae bacterium]|nr:SPFH domain-containing protein [Selenomonadaceae bacterium]MBR6343609.1 SPFH domain-containing protein [Selenomonadaceae bacterium]MBR6711137.1 SPFH domain-containing protein [Selenomonadaceae bacterium]